MALTHYEKLVESALAHSPSPSTTNLQSPLPRLNPTAAAYTPSFQERRLIRVTPPTPRGHPSSIVDDEFQQMRNKAVAHGHHTGLEAGYKNGVTHGRAAGRSEGFDAGRKEGFEAGSQYGFVEGQQKGMEVGRHLGFNEGVAEGMRRAREELGGKEREE